MGLITTIIRRLFGATPRYYESAYEPLYASVVACLKAASLKVGGTAGYPRLEVHSITEGQRLDKDGAVRTLTLTVESISSSSLVEAAQNSDAAMAAITAEGALEPGEGWDVLTVDPVQLQDLTETSDSAKIIYRILQSYEVIVERKKTSDPDSFILLTPEPEPEPEPESEEEPEPQDGGEGETENQE